MLINQVAYSCSQRGRQASNEECKQALLLPCVNDSQCKQAKKKSKQAMFYCVSVTPTRNVFHVCKALGKHTKINKQAKKKKQASCVLLCVSISQ